MANLEFFSLHLIKAARQIKGLSVQESKKLLEIFDQFIFIADN
jgi:ribosomal protein L7/L12